MSDESVHQRERPPEAAEEGTSMADRDVTRTEMRVRWTSLTSRQRQVMQLIVAGLTSQEMAEHLRISVRTIEAHRANIMVKMGTKRVAELVRWTLSVDLY